jgi:xylulose-5-phosphate/fructose-6-phosphate phosphoketolase
MKMVSPSEHPHGLSHAAFDSIFTREKPVIFAFHAFPHMVEKLIFGRYNRNFTIRGYNEEGTISTAFDMTVMNNLDRFHLVIDVCDKVETECTNVDSATKWSASYLKQEMEIALLRHKKYIHEFGVDMDEVKDWKWDV